MYFSFALAGIEAHAYAHYTSLLCFALMSSSVKVFETKLNKFWNDQPMKFYYKEKLRLFTPGSGHTSNILRPEYGVTKHRTDRTDRTGGEIAAGKAQINCRDLVINLYTAYHPIHD